MIGFHIEGIDEVNEVFASLPYTLQKRVVRKASVKAADDLLWQVRRNIDSDTGLMSEAMQATPFTYTEKERGKVEATYFDAKGEAGALLALAAGQLEVTPIKFASSAQSFLYGMAASAFGVGQFSSKTFRTVIQRHGARVGVNWRSLRRANNAKPAGTRRRLPDSDTGYFYPAAVELGTNYNRPKKPLRKAASQVKNLVIWAFRIEMVRLLSSVK